MVTPDPLDLARTGSRAFEREQDGGGLDRVDAGERGQDAGEVGVQRTGIGCEQTDAFAAAASEDRETAWTDQYMRLSIRFDTGAPRYRWLTTSLFVAAGRLPGTSSTPCTGSPERAGPAAC